MNVIVYDRMGVLQSRKANLKRLEVKWLSHTYHLGLIIEGVFFWECVFRRWNDPVIVEKLPPRSSRKPWNFESVSYPMHRWH